MIFNSHTVLISGAGQLGSRYLQGLSKCKTPLCINVQDISTEALRQAEWRWQEVGGPLTNHEVLFHTEIRKCSQHYDLAIIATTAHSRPEVVKGVAQHSKVCYWLLEKVLAQNTLGLDEIQFYVGSKSLAWVGNPRRIVPWHRLIKEHLKLGSPLHLTVSGGPWGLACNAVHFLDLLAWWSGESLESVCTDQLEDRWFQSKRSGYWEIHGTLRATFSGGSTAKLISRHSGDPTNLIELTEGKSSWRIDEVKGTAICSSGLEIPGLLPYQSEITAEIVDEILSSGNCQLPTLATSLTIHRIFIDSMLGHWQQHNDPSALFVPIT
jgi:hypothetical protein